MMASFSLSSYFYSLLNNSCSPFHYTYIYIYIYHSPMSCRLMIIWMLINSVADGLVLNVDVSAANMEVAGCSQVGSHLFIHSSSFLFGNVFVQLTMGSVMVGLLARRQS